MGAVSTVVFSYCGSPAFLNVASEMRRPKDFSKAVVTCQSIVTAVYLTIGIVVWYYCGRYVSSPALGSAGPLLKRVSYGIALPGLFVSVSCSILPPHPFRELTETPVPLLRLPFTHMWSPRWSSFASSGVSF